MSRPSARDILMRVLRQTAAEREAIIMETTNHPAQIQVEHTTFLSHVVNSFFGGDEDQMFRQFNINRTVFDAAFNLVSSIPLPRRGRRSFVQTHRDKLLFLFLFLTNGTKVLSKVCLPRLNCQSAILHHLHEAATLFIQPLLTNTVLFFHERVEDLPHVSSVVDCTVVEIKGPDTPFRQQDSYYSGKHKRHCLKKEVIVNVRSGRAAMISQEYPGSVADIEVLRRHSFEVNEMLRDSQMLADLGYRGETNVPNCHVVRQTSETEKRTRLIVERFFGRLKNYFIVFSRTWELSPRCFSAFFDLACALTNLTILVSPLNQEDWVFNVNLLRKWKRQEVERQLALEQKGNA